MKLFVATSDLPDACLPALRNLVLRNLATLDRVGGAKVSHPVTGSLNKRFAAG